AHFAFSRNNCFKYLSWSFCIAKCSRDHTKIACYEVSQLRAKIQMPFLCELKGSHHCFWVLHKVGSTPRKELSIADTKVIDYFLRSFQTWQKAKKRACTG